MEVNYQDLQKNEQSIVPTVWNILRTEAEEVARREALMRPLIEEAILQHKDFKSALSFRLATKLAGRLIPSEQWLKIFEEAYSLKQLDYAEYDLESAACLDLAAVKDRDPACDKLFTAFMFFKGYKALQIYRVSHVLWHSGRKELACLMQSRTSEVFSVDIHPAAKIGRGLMIDHATGLVIGETAVVGEHCSFLHGVTLGATGKEAGDRHPKVGNNVAIGCNASIIGNIRIGNNAKIGSSSVVIKPVPDDCTAVGSPARIITPKPAAPVHPVKEDKAHQEAVTVHSSSSSHAEKTKTVSEEVSSSTGLKSIPNVVFATSSSSSDSGNVSTAPNNTVTAAIVAKQGGTHCHFNPPVIQTLGILDFGNLPENLVLILMPLFLLYSVITTTGCV